MEGADWLRGRARAEPKILSGSDVQQMGENRTRQKRKQTQRQSPEHSSWFLLRYRRPGISGPSPVLDRWLSSRSSNLLMLASSLKLKSHRTGNRQSRKYGFQPQTTSEERPHPPSLSFSFPPPPSPMCTQHPSLPGGLEFLLSRQRQTTVAVAMLQNKGENH